MTIGMRRLALAAVPLATMMGGAASAQELRIGLAAEASSIDPHFHNLTPNNQLRRHIFEALTGADENQKPTPELAASWRTVDETTWEFKLRPGVKFSNGTEFTAKDVIYSYCRAPTVENSPSSFASNVRGISAMDAPDPLTLVIKTASPLPLLPSNLGNVGIISAELNGGANVRFKAGGCENLGTAPKSADFNEPAKAVGTGPFKLANYTRGTHVILERNEGYWGQKPQWAKVTLRPLTNAGGRVAALLAGDVDMIENPPIQDFDRIKSGNFQIAEALSNRIIYLHLDQFTGEGWKTPGIKGADKNPLLDKRVREAISKAINRPAIVERIMGGHAVAAGELLPFPLFGATKDFPITKFDADGAKKLLAEAGYPNGFEITLGTPNDRYINDEKISQAVAQMLSRVGIKVNVDAMTASTFFSRRNRFEFSMYLAGWGADTGEMSNSLSALVVTRQPEKGLGGTNAGRYSNKQVDELVVKAMATVDNAAREKLLQEASKLAMGDYGIIPLHFEVTPWAFKKGLTYKARVDQYTLASEVRQAGS